jgi:hypothetical protein
MRRRERGGGREVFSAFRCKPFRTIKSKRSRGVLKSEHHSPTDNERFSIAAFSSPKNADGGLGCDANR